MEFDRYYSQGKIVEHVPAGSRVLDIGCNVGNVARALVAKGCTVVGIEIDPEAAEKARDACSQVHVMDIEKATALPYPHAHFDVILYGDVLEHMVRPEAVIRNLKPYLAPTGTLIASIPNVANWAIRLRLLSGRFDYEKTGILFDQHLRFFTYRTAQALVTQAGFTIHRVDVTPGFHVSHTYTWLVGRFLGRLPGYGFAVYTAARIFRRLLAQQFIIIARPAST